MTNLDSNPVVRAFFLGRATAAVFRERVETALTDLASEVGKGLAEWQENWRTFPDDVLARANQEQVTPDPETSGLGSLQSDDLQAALDDLRAEVAQLRSELKKYRNQST